MPSDKSNNNISNNNNNGGGGEEEEQPRYFRFFALEDEEAVEMARARARGRGGWYSGAVNMLDTPIRRDRPAWVRFGDPRRTQSAEQAEDVAPDVVAAPLPPIVDANDSGSSDDVWHDALAALDRMDTSGSDEYLDAVEHQEEPAPRRAPKRPSTPLVDEDEQPPIKAAKVGDDVEVVDEVVDMDVDEPEDNASGAGSPVLSPGASPARRRRRRVAGPPRWIRRGRRLQRIKEPKPAAADVRQPDNLAGDANLDATWNAELELQSALDRIQRFLANVADLLEDPEALDLRDLHALEDCRQAAGRTRATLRRLLRQEAEHGDVDDAKINDVMAKLSVKLVDCVVQF